jgi:hypothetical protein
VDASRLFDLVVLVFLLLLLWQLLPRAWRVTQIYAGIRSRRLEDGSAIAPPPPAGVARLGDGLAQIGFRRIGERTLVLPGVGRRFEWNLVDESTTTYAALVPVATSPLGARLSCYSAFADGAFVATSFPDGSVVQRDDLWTGPAGRTPAECVEEHRRRVSEFASRHGAPLRNQTMTDLLDRDATYRQRHGGATLRRRVWLFDGFVALAFAAAVVTTLRLLVET